VNAVILAEGRDAGAKGDAKTKAKDRSSFAFMVKNSVIRSQANLLRQERAFSTKTAVRIH
jgi:hypothetical protein